MASALESRSRDIYQPVNRLTGATLLMDSGINGEDPVRVVSPSPEDMRTLDGFNEDLHTSWDPTDVD